MSEKKIHNLALFINRSKAIVTEFRKKAFSSSLYQSPGDILFTGISLACDLLSKATQKNITFCCFVANRQTGTLCQWETAYGLLDHLKSSVAQKQSDKFSRINLCEEKTVYFSASIGASTEEQLTEFCLYIENQWKALLEEYTHEFCLGLGYTEKLPSEHEIDCDFSEQLNRTTTTRLKEGLQRIEDELPGSYRRATSNIPGASPRHVEFIWRHELNNKRSDPGLSLDCPSLITTHEDLRLMREKLPEFRQDIIQQFLDLQIDVNDKTTNERLLELLLERYEQPVSRPDYRQGSDLEKTLLLGAPVLIPSADNGQGAIFNMAHKMLSQSKIREPGLLYWPVYIMGKPQFLLVTGFKSAEPLQADNATFDDFVGLLRGLLRVQEVAWNILFDVYHDIMIEIFGDIYLVSLRKTFDHKNSVEPATFIVEQMNKVSAYLGSVFNLYTSTWSVANEKVGEKPAVSLYALQEEVSWSEGNHDDFQIPEEEEMRLKVLQGEADKLRKIRLLPVSSPTDNAPERLNMFHHIAWRLGYYVRYQLPELLMTLHYHADFILEKERSVLRHELGGLITSARRVLNQVKNNPSEARYADLGLLMRLMQRTVEATGTGGKRQEYYLADSALDLPAFFTSLQGLFQSKFKLQTEKGPEGKGRVIVLNTDDAPMEQPITGEDIYALWRNLWDNSRKAIQDYSRETVGEERINKRRQIIEQYKPFSLRHHIDHIPQPQLLALIYNAPSPGNALIRLDILDNVPQLAAAAIEYPVNVEPGHLGLGLVYAMAEGLTNVGLPVKFKHLRPLDKATANFYKQQRALADYQWQPQYWSISRLEFTCGIPL